ncbi:hypothetical protein FQY83_02960 [Luteimonas marina]|uniref:Uncharacterized protein n=1 Tax=Luteimonas marina TaxID=488485 RepID=A0A5C5UDR2_9GAMM|nr:hypothetical protein [Luteimonas marina]TWT23605.1 hypothetical protein FQY83_02960 [Luteimonas marina]
MCEPVTLGIIMGASSLLAGGSAVHQGQTQKNYNNYLANQAEADARAEAGAAQVEAERIRKAGKKQRSEAIAALAASGVDVNSGTALVIDREIARGAEEDAFLTMAGGSDRAARLSADASGRRGAASRAGTAGYINAASTLLQAGTNYGRGWKKPRGG